MRLAVTPNSRVRDRLTVPGSSGPTVPEAILALTPAGYWKLQETAGTTAVDSSGNTRNGAYAGGIVINNVAGPDGFNYPTWDGVNDTMDVADNNAWSIDTSGTGLTVLAIVKFASDPGATNRAICEKANPGSPFNIEWVFAINNGSFGLQLYTPGGSSIRATNGAWTYAAGWHVFMVAVPSVSANGAAYHNGATVTAAPGGGAGVYVNNNASLHYGGINTVLGRMIGAMGHLAVFPTELNATQIGTIMTAADTAGWY